MKNRYLNEKVWPDWKLNSEFNVRQLTIMLRLGVLVFTLEGAGALMLACA
jgi:hypothetical protein